MNESAIEEVYEQLIRAFELEEGDEQISLLEEAVRLADLLGDLNTQYLAREQLIRACMFGGPYEKALVAFSWCLAQFDKNPGKFSEWEILWKYKWIVAIIYDFPEVPKARIFEMLDDLAERSLRAGYGLRAVYNHRYNLERFWGNQAEAIEYFHKMAEQPKDGLNNCSACELHARFTFTVYCGNDESGVELALPLLNGKQQCTTVPHRTYADILLPLVRLGRQQEALQYHRKGYELIADNKTYLDKIADHLIFLTLTENFARAVEVFENHYPWFESSRDALHRFRFSRAAWLLFEMISEQQSSLEMSLPRHSALYSENGRYATTQLADWFKQKATEVGKRFDHRNETDFFMRTLAETPLLKQLSASFPLGE